MSTHGVQEGDPSEERVWQPTEDAGKGTFSEDAGKGTFTLHGGHWASKEQSLWLLAFIITFFFYDLKFSFLFLFFFPKRATIVIQNNMAMT